VGFDAGVFTLRGTSIAIYDYAMTNESILNNKSIVFYNASSSQHQLSVLNKFKKRFEIIPYFDLVQLEYLAEKYKIDYLYFIKSGENDGYIINSVPSLVHAVFPQKISQVHGRHYAFVSEWLSKTSSNYKIPFVPHMIVKSHSNESLRSDLAIPESARVFAYYGGATSFNISFVKDCIKKVVEANRMIYFLFMNIPSFIKHQQVIFLDGAADLNYKTKFINTADAMIHAQGLGESFGLACGEFSITQ